jgi:transcriptional regulator with XRE-family HTH domain
VDTGRFQAEFGRKVRELRLARGLSQEALAAAAGLHPTHISLIETGKRVVRLTTIQNLAVGLKIQPSELMPPLK